jgi:hypothetical protein
MKKITKMLLVTFVATGLIVSCKDKTKSAPEMHGTITFLRGNVLLNQAPVQIGAKIKMSDTIEVKDKSTAVIQFSTNAMITIESNTNLVVKNLVQGEDGIPSIALDQSRGSTFNKIVPGKANYTVNTPTITAGVRGTAFRVSQSATENGTEIELFTGKVALTKDPEAVSEGKSEETILEAGHKILITETEIKEPVKLKIEEIKNLEKLNDIAMLPDKKLDKIETIENVSEVEAKEIEKEMNDQVVPEASHKILIMMEEEVEKPAITLDDIKAQYGSLSKVTTKNGKSYVGAFKQFGGKFEIYTVTGTEVVSASDIAKVSPVE